jgi:transcriptional regulator with AAA-type ATPase domain
MSDTSTLSESGGAPEKGVGPSACLYLALECRRPLLPSRRWSLAELDAVILGRGGELGAERVVEEGERRLYVRVPDGWMSSSHAQLRRVYDEWMLKDAQSKNGTLLNGQPLTRAALSDGDLFELGRTFFLFRDGEAAGEGDPGDVIGDALPTAAPGLTTFAPPLAKQFSSLAEVAKADLPVVVQGESGTGKELIARAVHALSRRGGACVAVNCAALPATLVESELFGYRKGAFSGAVEDRPGLIRAADRGTLFLDEIGDLPLPSQAAFLRVLQEREVTPVGGTKPIPVDIRLVAATHRDLDQLVARGQFRADLYARISGFTLRLPPLRARREDLGLLIATLLRRVAPDRAEKITFGADAARALFRYRWPLNIRELEKCLSAAAVLARRSHVELAHLPDPVQAALDEPADAARDQPAELDPADAARREEIVALLAENAGSVSAVARAMGKARMQIQRWIKRYRIEPKQFRSE